MQMPSLCIRKDLPLCSASPDPHRESAPGILSPQTAGNPSHTEPDNLPERSSYPRYDSVPLPLYLRPSIPRIPPERLHKRRSTHCRNTRTGSYNDPPDCQQSTFPVPSQHSHSHQSSWQIPDILNNKALR